MRRCSTWLKPKGKLFVHIFVHKSLPYHFEVSRAARRARGTSLMAKKKEGGFFCLSFLTLDSASLPGPARRLRAKPTG